MAARVCNRHAAIGLLVNNAGIPGRDSFLRLDPERIEQVLRTNYLGGLWCLRAFLPALAAARPAHVVNIVSVAGTVALVPSGPYSASKHAQLAFSRATAAELRPRGIAVHTVNPGYVETELTGGLPEGIKDQIRAQVPIGRFGEAGEVAEVVAFLAGEGAGYMTGQTLAVDGGMTMQ